MEEVRRLRLVSLGAALLAMLGIMMPMWAWAGKTASEFYQHLGAGARLYDAGQHDAAVREFKAAVALQPGDSTAHLWLARALGRKTETANALVAALEVSHVRKEFELAVALDPNNLEARSDLLEFYLEAPRLFGGGIEKAQAQAEAIAKLDPAEGQRARTHIAEKERGRKALAQQ